MIVTVGAVVVVCCFLLTIVHLATAFTLYRQADWDDADMSGAGFGESYSDGLGWGDPSNAPEED